VRIQCLVPIYVFPAMKLRGLSVSKTELKCAVSQYHIHVSVSDLYIPRIWNEAVQFHFSECINRIFCTMYIGLKTSSCSVMGGLQSAASCNVKRYTLKSYNRTKNANSKKVFTAQYFCAQFNEQK